MIMFLIILFSFSYVTGFSCNNESYRVYSKPPILENIEQPVWTKEEGWHFVTEELNEEYNTPTRIEVLLTFKNGSQMILAPSQTWLTDYTYSGIKPVVWGLWWQTEALLKEDRLKNEIHPNKLYILDFNSVKHFLLFCRGIK